MDHPMLFTCVSAEESPVHTIWAQHQQPLDRQQASGLWAAQSNVRMSSGQRQAAECCHWRPFACSRSEVKGKSKLHLRLVHKPCQSHAAAQSEARMYPCCLQ